MTTPTHNLAPFTLAPFFALLLIALTACSSTPKPKPSNTIASDTTIQRALNDLRSRWTSMHPEHPMPTPTLQTSRTISPPSTANPNGVRARHYTLPNGLHILLVEDHSAPIFAYQTWFNVGSGDESPGTTGIAHLFEHLMFKETKNLEEGEFDKIMEENGAETNAATWLDWTMYRAELPAGKLDLAVQLEADRLEHMTLDTKQLESEREVVKNERRYRVDNDPDGTMYEALYKIALAGTPYHWPTLGWMDDLDAITLQNCLDFHRTWYTPNNATIIVVGDFDPAHALSTITAHYGHLPRGPKPAPSSYAPNPEEAQQSKERRKLVVLPLSSPKLLIGYRSPSLTHPDQPALMVLHQILLEGRSSRLYKRLITDEELVTDAEGYVSDFTHDGLYEIMLTLKPDVSPEHVQRIVDQELHTIQNQPISTRELTKAINQIEIGFMREMQSFGDQAYLLGHTFSTAGDWTLAFQLPSRVNDVTPEDVQRVANTYLTTSKRTTIVAMPKP